MAQRLVAAGNPSTLFPKKERIWGEGEAGEENIFHRLDGNRKGIHSPKDSIGGQ
jgi:hypothetical protein